MPAPPRAVPAPRLNIGSGGGGPGAPRLQTSGSRLAPSVANRQPTGGLRPTGGVKLDHKVPKMGGGGLGNPQAMAAMAAQSRGMGQQKHPYQCIQQGCFRVTVPGPSGTAFYKEGNQGPFCGEHFADEIVTHPGPNTWSPPCRFGAHYKPEQWELMKKIVTTVRQDCGTRNVPITYALFDEAFRKFPPLRCQLKCPDCSSVVTWWPDPRNPVFELNRVVVG